VASHGLVTYHERECDAVLESTAHEGIEAVHLVPCGLDGELLVGVDLQQWRTMRQLEEDACGAAEPIERAAESAAER